MQTPQGLRDNIKAHEQFVQYIVLNQLKFISFKEDKMFRQTRTQTHSAAAVVFPPMDIFN